VTSFYRETGYRKNLGPEGRQRIAPGERSEPGVGYRATESPGRGERPYLAMDFFRPFRALSRCPILPGVRCAHPWLLSFAAPRLEKPLIPGYYLAPLRGFGKLLISTNGAGVAGASWFKFQLNGSHRRPFYKWLNSYAGFASALIWKVLVQQRK
jgi:hypothetical protein